MEVMMENCLASWFQRLTQKKKILSHHKFHIRLQYSHRIKSSLKNIQAMLKLNQKEQLLQALLRIY
jgi:hypothetical protein